MGTVRKHNNTEKEDFNTSERIEKVFINEQNDKNILDTNHIIILFIALMCEFFFYSVMNIVLLTI